MMFGLRLCNYLSHLGLRLWDNSRKTKDLGSCYAGTMQTLDARHIELFLSEGFRDGSWEYRLLGTHDIKKHAESASGGIFDIKHLNHPSTAGSYSLLLIISCTLCLSTRLNTISITLSKWACSFGGMHPLLQVVHRKT